VGLLVHEKLAPTIGYPATRSASASAQFGSISMLN